MGKVSRWFRWLCSVAPVVCSLSVESCVPQELEGIHFSIPVNSGPTPQVEQPAQPAPPLPKDTLHPMSEWPPKKP